MGEHDARVDPLTINYSHLACLSDSLHACSSGKSPTDTHAHSHKHTSPLLDVLNPRLIPEIWLQLA